MSDSNSSSQVFHVLGIGRIYYPRIHSSMGQAYSLIAVTYLRYLAHLGSCMFPNGSIGPLHRWLAN
ncbi:hypothetical protein SCLCIDRAFT_1214195 [Scleroderma citrinum Foug A]|uniref:Uncharacterized protein n=1 Tax=Scleroderma citrinum Foug A TaxID=1036808 RepID=A0A0C3AF26_9AGAM|nr:hypothetical protein SCLCIDRAFT_1214195 [Scleroderma citrinum Foug A]